MRERHPSATIAITIVLFFCMCVHARAGDGGRALIHRTAPTYPELAKQMRLGGSVILLLSIEPDGVVSDVKVQSGHPLLVPAAINAVRQWKFAPSSQASQSTVSVTFESR